MSSPRLTFLGWNLPLSTAAADHLCLGWQGGLLDLSDVLVIVSTAQAGRRLRETLTIRADERGGAVLSPLVITPEVLLDWAEEEQPGGAASTGEAVLAWAEQLRQADLEDFRALFPVDPVSQDFPWALQVAGDLRRLRRTLGEAGLGLREAAARLGDDHPEAERWLALAGVEHLCETALADLGRADPERVRINALGTPRVPEEIRRIFLIAVPDPVTAAVRLLDDLARTLPVEVLVHAPPGEAGGFDDWGRPLPEAWSERPIAVPRAGEEILMFTRPENEAEYLADELRRHGGPRGSFALGVTDTEVSQPLENLAAGAGIRLFNPEGKPLLHHELCWLLRCLTDLVKTDSFAAAEQLLRIPDAADCILRSIREADPTATPSLRMLAQQTDDFRDERLPISLSLALPLAADWEDEAAGRAASRGREPSPKFVREALNWMANAADGLRNAADFAGALADLLAEIYRQRKHGTAAEAREFDTAAGHLSRVLEAVQQGSVLFAPHLPAEAKLDLVLHLLREAMLYPEAAGGEIDLQGWLELPWEDAPRLCIAGMNEGRVPEAVTGDRWLPDGARAVLGLRTNAGRLARDVFQLTGLIETRRTEGRVTLLAARETAAGDPLKPSRLLLACPDDELPARARQIFTADSAAPRRQALAWQRAWTLRPPPPTGEMLPGATISVTRFGDWLACPFRYYLKHVLHMEPQEPMVDEMDARAFGNLIHHCMETLHADPELRDCTDEHPIAARLRQAAADHLHRLHGPVLPVPLMIQLEAAQNRLTAAARLHAEARAEGWRHYYCEVDFPSLPGATEAFKIEGIELRGRIDLIEQHEDGRIRILDYKTFGQPKSPMDKHCGRVPRQPPRDLHPFEFLPEEGMRWLDLQLPLYAYVARQLWGERVDVGYVLLPRAATESRTEMWSGLDRATLDSAYECAGGIIREIVAGHFWPPAEKPRFDDFEALFFRGVTESVDENWNTPPEISGARKKHLKA